MSDTFTTWPAVTATLFNVRLPGLGTVVIFTRWNSSAPAVLAPSIGSVNPKSPAANVSVPSSRTVTVLFVPAGASFTLVMLVSSATPDAATWEVEVSVVVLKVWRVAPLVNAVVALSSTAWTVSEPGAPLKLAAGRKRRRVSVFSRRAAVVETVPTSRQVSPLVLYCHLPCPDALASVATAIPVKVSPSAVSLNLLLNSELTVAPGGSGASSSTAASEAPPVKLGAVFAVKTKSLLPAPPV